MGWGGDRGCQYQRLRVLRAGHLLDGDRYGLAGDGTREDIGIGSIWDGLGVRGGWFAVIT